MLNRNPVVSAVICARNAAKYLAYAIESIRYQTYPDFEIIVVDDHSTDDTFNIVKCFSDPRIRCYRMRRKKHWERLGATRNYAIAQALGDFVAICDSDDVRYPNSFEEEVSSLLHNPNTALVGTLYDELDPEGFVIGNPDAETISRHTGFFIPQDRYRDERSWRISLAGCPSQVLRDIYLSRRGPYSCPLAPTTTMFRLDLFKLVGQYNPKAHYFVDVDLHRRFAAKYDIHLIPSVLAGWRQHPGRMSIEQWRRGGEPASKDSGLL